MRDFPGAPGTYLFFVLKCSQLLLSACVTVWLLLMSIAAAHHYNYYLPGVRFSTTRFSLFAIMSMLMFAETVLIYLTCLAAYDLAKKVAVRHDFLFLGVLAAIDWISATFSLAVASALLSTSMDFADELMLLICEGGGALCRILQLMFIPAFISWLANALSHLITVWFMAGGV